MASEKKNIFVLFTIVIKQFMFYIMPPITVYRVLNATLNYCDFPDLKQIAVERMRFQTE